MHKIYFDRRCIIICPPQEQTLSDPNAICFIPGDRIDIHSLIGMFQVNDSLQRIYIPTEEVQATYDRICDEFVQVDAGGGLVSNRRGDFLLIRRMGLWDLPKGHREPGEDIRECSLREVSEETGIESLELRDLICITDHCYFRAGKWHLKHTWWYDMFYNDPGELTPQREEDITKAAWVAKSSLPGMLKTSFPSIQEVFREAKI